MRPVSDTEDFDAILEDHSLVLVDFTASWCGPCKRIKPSLKIMDTEFENVFFCTVDVDQCEELAKTYEIFSMPTFHFFKNGKLVPDLTITGANEKEIRESLKTFNH